MQVNVCDPFPKQKLIRLAHFIVLYHIITPCPNLYSLFICHFSLPLCPYSQSKERRDKSGKVTLPYVPLPDFLLGGSEPRFGELL